MNLYFLFFMGIVFGMFLSWIFYRIYSIHEVLPKGLDELSQRITSATEKREKLESQLGFEKAKNTIGIEQMYDLFFFRYFPPEVQNDVKALFGVHLMRYSKELAEHPDNVEAQAGKEYYEGLLKRISLNEKAEE